MSALSLLLVWRTPNAPPQLADHPLLGYPPKKVACVEVGSLMESYLCRHGGPPPWLADAPLAGYLPPLAGCLPLAWHDNVMDGWGARPLRWQNVYTCLTQSFFIPGKRIKLYTSFLGQSQNSGFIGFLGCVRTLFVVQLLADYDSKPLNRVTHAYPIWVCQKKLLGHSRGSKCHLGLSYCLRVRDYSWFWF